MHPYKAQILHIDFQRVSRKDTISMSVPIHLRGADEAPGVKAVSYTHLTLPTTPYV